MTDNHLLLSPPTSRSLTDSTFFDRETVTATVTASAPVLNAGCLQIHGTDLDGHYVIFGQATDLNLEFTQSLSQASLFSIDSSNQYLTSLYDPGYGSGPQPFYASQEFSGDDEITMYSNDSGDDEIDFPSWTVSSDGYVTAVENGDPRNLLVVCNEDGYYYYLGITEGPLFGVYNGPCQVPQLTFVQAP